MEKKRYVDGIMDMFSIFVLMAIVLFISCAILTVLVGGLPVLKNAVTSPELQYSIRLSFLTASISTLICFLLSVPACYALTRSAVPFKKVLVSIIELPLTLPYLVLGLCLLIVFSSPWGKMLKEAGVRVVFDVKGIIIAQIMVNLPFVIRLVRSAFSEVDKRLESVAGILGATRWERFITITLPLSQSAILSALVLSWSRALGEFGATLMLVGVTRMKTETLPASIYLHISTGNIDMAMASATILLVFSAITSFAAHLASKKGSDSG